MMFDSQQQSHRNEHMTAIHIAHLEEAVQDRNKEISRLVEENATLIRNHLDEWAVVFEEREEIQGEVEELRLDKEELRDRILDLEGELDDTKGEVEELRDKIRVLEEQIEELGEDPR